jgi:hypothetical protein
MTDLTYCTKGNFASFMPRSPDGEDAWRKIAAKTEGTGNVYTPHLASTLQQLRAAGYSVHKAKASDLSKVNLDDALLADLLD